MRTLAEIERLRDAVALVQGADTSLSGVRGARRQREVLKRVERSLSVEVSRALAERAEQVTG